MQVISTHILLSKLWSQDDILSFNNKRVHFFSAYLQAALLRDKIKRYEIAIL